MPRPRRNVELEGQKALAELLAFQRKGEDLINLIKEAGVLDEVVHMLGPSYDTVDETT